MNEEKKTYDFTGTVTISTEEYRELIERAIRSEIEARGQSTKWYEEYKRVAELQKKNSRFEEFIKSDEDAYAMYTTWLAGREEKDGI